MRLLRQCMLGLCFFSSMVFASAETDQLTARFEKLGVAVTDIKPADISGMFEIHTNSGVLFSDAKGQYFIAGTLYQLHDDGQYTDVIAKRQAPLNAAKIEKKADEMIVYPADDEKYVVTVFTDITCGYCVRLHSQLEQYNKAGITIRYLAFPRQGPTGDVAHQMAAIWCADDQKQALSDAKLHRDALVFDSKAQQCQSKIEQHYQLGRDLGVQGTPAIFLPNGEMVGGYLPADKLLARLEAMDK